jgi:MFS family permease
MLADPGLRRITLVAGAMSLATTVGYWGVSTFVPQYFASVAAPAGWDAARATSVSGMVYTAGAVAGYLAVGFLAESWGRKPTVAVLFAGALVLTPIVFLWVHTVPVLLTLLFVNGAFTLGQYGWMAIWMDGDLAARALPHQRAGHRNRIGVQCFSATRLRRPTRRG